MAEFKIVISDPTEGKCYQVEAKEGDADFFLDKKVGDKVKGDHFGQKGYEFEITGGSDKCGFPMRKDLEGTMRKRILIVKGVGIRNKEKGMRKKKTVVGNTISKTISQINLKIVKGGKFKTAEPAAEEKPAEEKTE